MSGQALDLQKFPRSMRGFCVYLERYLKYESCPLLQMPFPSMARKSLVRVAATTQRPIGGHQKRWRIQYKFHLLVVLKEVRANCLATMKMKAEPVAGCI